MAMLKAITILAVVFLFARAAIRTDIVSKVPGYGDHFQSNVYSGYLNTSSETRQLHYVFIESEKGANSSDPVTVWLNGGPGCSSLLGFLQEIGPFYMEEGVNYTDGDPLTENPYSWHKVSHLLFIQSPAGVGYSINSDPKFQYNDVTTAKDNLDALKFFFTYYPQYAKNQLYLSGESYAGKYIPDLARDIMFDNDKPETKTKMNLTGVFIGNGVINFRDDSLEKSQIEFMMSHGFVDPQVKFYWETSCQQDPESAGCMYFLNKFEQNTQQINPYNIYSYCFYNDSFAQNSNTDKKQFLSQQSILLSLSKNKNFGSDKKFNGAPCAYFDGLYQYFNIHAETFHAKNNKWNGPCAQDISSKYQIDQDGSMASMRFIIEKEMEGFIVVLYNGDWDSVVPYIDTIKNLEKLDMKESYLYTPIFTNDQHIGFSQVYSGMNFILVKGASHQVPQSKREAALHIFESLVGHDSLYVPTSYGKPPRKIPNLQL